MGSVSFLLFIFVLDEVLPIDHASPKAAIQFIKTEVATRVEQTRFLTDKESTERSMRLYNKRHLPGLRKEVIVQPGIIMGEKDSHTRVGVIPANDLLPVMVLFNLVMNIDNAILCEREIDGALFGIACRQSMINKDELFSLFGIDTPLPYQKTSDLILHITRRMNTDTTVSRLRHKDAYQRFQACIIILRVPAVRFIYRIRCGNRLVHVRRGNMDTKFCHIDSLLLTPQRAGRGRDSLADLSSRHVGCHHQ